MEQGLLHSISHLMWWMPSRKLQPLWWWEGSPIVQKGIASHAVSRHSIFATWGPWDIISLVIQKMGIHVAQTMTSPWKDSHLSIQWAISIISLFFMLNHSILLKSIRNNCLPRNAMRVEKLSLMMDMWYIMSLMMRVDPGTCFKDKKVWDRKFFLMWPIIRSHTTHCRCRGAINDVCCTNSDLSPKR